MTPYQIRRWDAIVLAVMCWVIAIGFSVEKFVRDGITSYALLIAMPVLAVAAGVLLHEAWSRLCRLNVLAFGLFGALALLALAVTLPVSIGNSAASTDRSIADVKKAMEDHSRLLAEHDKAQASVKEAQNWVRKHCKKEVATDDCKESRADLEQREQRVNDLSARLTAEKPATGSPSGDRRIAWVLNLFGYSATESDVAMGWPILPPAVAELLSAVFLAMGLERRTVPAAPRASRRLFARREDSHVVLAEAPKALAAPATLPTSVGGTKTKQEALADLLALLAAKEPIPSQDWLKERWQLGSKGTVSKWLDDWESAGIDARSSIVKTKQSEST